MALDHNSQVPQESSRKVGLPPDYDALLAEVERAVNLLPDADDWDGDGSRGYSPDVRRRAVEFVTTGAVELWQRHSRSLPVPDIGPGPDGSIDFHWRPEGRELLLNLPADPEALVDFYGDTNDGETIKGRAHPPTVGPWILAWLTR